VLVGRRGRKGGPARAESPSMKVLIPSDENHFLKSIQP